VPNRSVIEAVIVGIVVMLAGTLPRNALFAANLRLFPSVPWAVPLIAVYLWFFWRYLDGNGPPPSTAEERHASLRARPLTPNVWTHALLAGGLAIVALVLALRLANRLVVLPDQQLPAMTNVPRLTVIALLLAAAPVAGIVEEASFRGYMQGPIERRYGLFVAILLTGTMFAVAHLDFTLILWPYYVAVAAIYGSITYLTNSILPAVVLHTAGNIFSNLDLWLHGHAEWQAAAGTATPIWDTGVDSSFWTSTVLLAGVAAAATFAYFRLARVTRSGLTRYRDGADLVGR
jgi:membrane protease YdiL (CAAX protease family)